MFFNDTATTESYQYLHTLSRHDALPIFLHLRGVALDPAIDLRMVDRNAAFRQHVLKVAIADRIATIPAHRPQDHITLEMAPLEIRHRSVRPISAKHAQASRFLQQSPGRYEMNAGQRGEIVHASVE